MTKFTLINEEFEIIDGVLNKYKGQSKTVVIPEGVTTINTKACSYNKDVVKITLPNSLKNIEAFSFEYCSELCNILISDTIEFVDGRAFNGCENLNFTYYDNAKYIGSENNPYMILIEVENKDCLSYNIHSDTKIICNTAFWCCRKLEKVIIPDNVIHIGNRAFEGCTSLTSVSIGKNVIHIGESAFERCSELKKVNFPEAIISIGKNSFKDCKTLTEVNFPNNLKSIGVSAFENCQSLKVVILPESTTHIEYGAFSGCVNLIHVQLPSLLEHIGSYAFSDCDSLTDINIPNGVKSIGNSVFPISNFRYTIYKNAKYVGNKNNKYLALVKTIDTSQKIYETHEDTKIICGEAFRYCEKLEAVKILGSDVIIGDYAFKECYNLTKIEWRGVSYIGCDAFYRCNGLTSVVIEGNETHIGCGAFKWCCNLKEVELCNGVKSIGGGAFANCKELTYIDIPDSVTSICPYAFEYCSSLKKLILPDSVTDIKKFAFSLCGLEYISHPEQENIFDIKDNVLINYKHLGYEKYIKIPDGVTCIEKEVFRDCHSLREIELPDSIVEIPSGLFLNTERYIDEAYRLHSNLNYNVYDNAKYLGNKNNPYLVLVSMQGRPTSCTIHKDTKVISDSAFYDSKLESIKIPPKIKNIGKRTFLGCNYLREVEIYKDLKSIDEEAFKGCLNLKIIYHGRKDDWLKTKIKDGNEPLSKAKIVFVE